MKYIKVIVRDKNTLILQEDANKDDLIDLSAINSVDFTAIEEAIKNGKELEYQKRLDENKKMLENLQKQKENQIVAEYARKIEDLEAKINETTKDKESELNLKIATLKLEHQKEIDELHNRIKSLEDNKKVQIENETLKLQQKYESEIKDLQSSIAKLESKHELDLKNKELEFEKTIKKTKDLHDQALAEKTKELKLKEDQVNELQRQKTMLNVKQTGEDLEAWCDNEIKSYMQNGLFNCTWEKDNKVIKEEDETKGSKADYIFKIFSSDKHLEKELLASVCLEMKDENPTSKNKKKNEDYYSALDKNRSKKQCKYALLVSNLESDKANDIAIYKVHEYEDMYVVRPAYMMTFLNMLISLTDKFSNLIIAKQKEQIELQNNLELNQLFDELKLKYLDKPLETLKNRVATIKSNSETITKAAQKIDETCNNIITNYIDEIIKKLNNFEIQINKGYKKFSI